MALYPAARKRLIRHDKAKDPRIKPRIVILHVDAGNSPSLYDYFNGRSGGVESHFHIPKVDQIEQYRDTDWQADANMLANFFAISVETQGFGKGTWNDKQLRDIKGLLLWAHKTHDIPLVECTRWDGSGIGWHNKFAKQWAGGPRECPGAERIKQIREIILPWAVEVTGGQAPSRPVIREGSTGSAVRTLQTLLNKVGGRLEVDGEFGSLTRATVVSFQKRAFPASKDQWDGVVGSKTWAALYALQPKVGG